MGTQPIIQLSNPCYSWPNSKCEYTHLVEYNPLHNDGRISIVLTKYLFAVNIQLKLPMYLGQWEVN